VLRISPFAIAPECSILFALNESFRQRQPLCIRSYTTCRLTDGGADSTSLLSLGSALGKIFFAKTLDDFTKQNNID
jgi:hypothetical protein